MKELRKEMGITQEEFTEKLDVSSRTISSWETGTNMLVICFEGGIENGL